MSASITEVLLTHEQIVDRCRELGNEISRDYQDKKLMVVGLLSGAVPFLAALINEISVPMQLDFIKARSYCGGLAHGQLELIHDLVLPVVDQDVLLVDDILDSGQTSSLIRARLLRKGARSVKICCLLEKKSAKKDYVISSDYLGFAIPNKFVIGFGLDYQEYYRNLPYIGVLSVSDDD